jgi:hypothetical protein
MKRICVNVTDEQAARLNASEEEFGVPQSVQIRKALDLLADECRRSYAFGRGNQFAGDPDHAGCCKSMEHTKQPVLVATKASE